MHDVVERLLRERGCVTAEEQHLFLNPDYVRDSFSPGLLVDIDRAVARIFRALENGERLAIYADFDCDGIPAAVVLHDFFTKIGYTNVRVYIPHRDAEGFGVHTKAIDTLIADKVTLIITVDVGSSAIEQVAYAQERGVDVIVTDHHEFAQSESGVDILPPAYAVINPKRKPEERSKKKEISSVDVVHTAMYPFPDLCGSGVAFKLVCALIAEGKKRAEKNDAQVYKPFAQIVDGWEKWLLDMVGLATIADMVPLVGENRMLATFGLMVLRKSRRPGVVALCKVAKIDQAHSTEETIGYTIAPRINAASRMGNPMLAFELFSTQDIVRAQACAEELEKLNNERKGLVGAIAKSAHEKIRTRYGSSPEKLLSKKSSGRSAQPDYFLENFSGELKCLPAVVVLGDPEWRPAVLGSVASTLAEHYKRPFFLWGREGTGLLKGSCRSHGGVDVLEIMTQSSHVLIQHGGHKMAGGFAIEDVHVLSLQEEFEKAYVRITHASEKHILQKSLENSSTFSYETNQTIFSEHVSPTQNQEAERGGLPIAISVADISLASIQELRKLAPFGIGNPEPVVQVCGVVVSVSQFGKEKNHFELVFADSKKLKVQARCMAFFSSPNSFSYAPHVGDEVCVTGTLSESRFAGRVRAELRVRDVVKGES